MLKKTVWSIIYFSMICGLYSTNFSDLVDKFIANQSKIKTFIGSGSLNIGIYNGSTLVKEVNSNINIFMKSPDLFKLVVLDSSKSIIVQKGDMMSKKIQGFDGVMTDKVDEMSNLFEKYFFMGLDKIKNNVNIESEEIVTIDNEKVFKFKLKSANNTLKDESGNNITIDYSELYFNVNGMLLKNIIFSKGKEFIKTEISYSSKNDMFIINKIKAITNSGEMRIINTTNYSTISVNTTILDKEFELK